MSSSSDPSAFLAALESGRLQWARFRASSWRDPEERGPADALAEEIDAFVEDTVDLDALDQGGVLPAGLLDILTSKGYFKLRLDGELGGHGLSDHDAFRVIGRVAERSVAVGQFLAIQNAVGAAALLPALPEGPLREFVRKRVQEGAVSGFAGTEPSGANNAWPETTAEPTEDGEAYVLNGEKLFTGAGGVAELLALTVTLAEEPRRVGVAFVDTDAPGLTVTSAIEFMGGRGLSNAALRLEDVRIPRDHVLAGVPEVPRFPPEIGPIALLSALFFNAAPALAIARQCLEWSREFVRRRSINGRVLGEYEHVQYILATMLADVHAMESVTQWCLLGADAPGRWFERSVAKNICTMTGWSVVDRTVSLLGGEGLETVRSKQRRGAVPAPVERLFRDARGLRTSGNVDFLLDIQAGRLLLAHFYAAPGRSPGAEPVELDDDLRGTGLSAADHDHLLALAADIARLSRTCADLVVRHPVPDELYAKQRTLRLLGRISAELLTMCVTLARTESGAGVPDLGQELTDVYCTRARHRLNGLWAELAAECDPRPGSPGSPGAPGTPGTPDYAKISQTWLDGL